MDDIDAEKLTNNRNDCVSKNRNQIFLWGDSHAGASYPGVNDLAIRNGLNVSQITGAKRVPFKGSSNIADEQYREAINYIGNIKPLFVFLDARWTVHGKPKDVFSKLENTINEIKERSPETVIYVIGPAPEWHDNLQKILYVMAVNGE
ncbi:SGNH hydrolase domain-containing protein, partial [Proteus mirabilis]